MVAGRGGLQDQAIHCCENEQLSNKGRHLFGNTMHEHVALTGRDAIVGGLY